MLWEEQAGKSASSGLDDRERKWLLIRTKSRIWPRRWCIKRKARRGGNERTGMGCGDSVDIRIKAGGSEKTKGIGKRGRERAKRFCRQRWAGRGAEGDDEHPLPPHGPDSHCGRNVLPRGQVPHLQERGARQRAWEACKTEPEPSEVEGTD